MILLDTHVVVWLYSDPQGLVPVSVRHRLDTEQLALSPFVRLELQYLYEVGKVAVPAQAIIDELAPKLELVLTDPPAAILCQVATTLDWTRNPFDRLISAQAVAAGTTLVTKDRVIREHLPLAWWAN
ncbi:type II toxin-antitoxin system VapC family toxin [Allorhizocola rhizosphaerae]|uniref:type II toxin-antitoxin system VapC family toxin n=1 Tax=Allorhizocola rhizosphaerae TaxID=1872709 RepID=UPI0013C2ECEF|nr:PIN domain-containing protein [Allorhizocola rhizosphaerae]